MPTFGLSPQGFNRKRLPDLKAELEADFRAAFGAALPLEGDSVAGQIIGILAEREAELWELLEAVYYSAFPDTAEGAALANAGALTGAAPLPAAFSIVEATATGTAATVLPAGRVVSVVGVPSAKFTTIADAVIGSDGTAALALQAVSAGPVDAPVGTLTVIETPVSGWASVTNAEPARKGRYAETDAEFRIRRVASLVSAQGGTAKAVENAVRLVEDVTFAACRENRTDTADESGRPPHSLEVVVIGGDDQEVAEAIWAAKPLGINTAGPYVKNVLDSFSVSQTIRFNRGTLVPVYLAVTLTTDSSSYPSDGHERVKAALLSHFATLNYGDDVVNWRLVSALSGIPGILTVSVAQGLSPAPTSSANTLINGHELATTSLAYITVSP